MLNYEKMLSLLMKYKIINNVLIDSEELSKTIFWDT